MKDSSIRFLVTKRHAVKILAGFILMFLILTDSSYSANQSTKHVLFISSYSPSFPTFFLQIQGLREELNDGTTVLDIEFMDTKRFPGEENQEVFYESLKRKMSSLPEYDVVIVSDDDGLHFVMKKKAELFPKTPIVFLGINNKENAKKYSEDPLVTGVVESVSIGDTIALASHLNPEATNVVALVDSMSAGQADLETFYEFRAQFPKLTFRALDLSVLSFSEFGDQLETLTSRDLVLCLSVYTDRNAEVKTFAEGLTFLLSHCNQPIYHPYYHGVGDGMLGGKVISHLEQGRAAGAIARQILDGTPPSEIPVVFKSPNPYFIDYEVLKQYGLREELLPVETVFINRNITVFERYYGIIVATLVGLIAQSFIIVTLYRNIQNRRRAELEIKKKQAELEDANSELITLNDEINELIHIDALTGMRNRFGIMKDLQQLIENPSDYPMFYTLFLDIDNFKNINDTFGHDLGDQIICETGHRLKHLTRSLQSEKANGEADFYMAGRFGGDEFLILVSTNNHSIKKVLESIQDVLKDLIVISDHHFYLTTSIGVAKYPIDGINCEELIKKADLALYEAKNSGKNKHVFFREAMSIAVEEKVKFQSELKTAFLNKEFHLCYQPFLRPIDQQVIGFEALLRWNGHDERPVSPSKIITNAEEIGLIVEIGNWVLEESFQFAKRISESIDRPILVSINISMVQMMYLDFFDDLMNLTRKVGISTNLICLEMTEAIMLQSQETGYALIERLKANGFTVALDDFGTGYASLGYFKSLPVNIVKIDQSFIDGMESEPANRHTIEAIIHLAHQLGLSVIAEGVEKKEQVDQLLKYQCDNIQGYYYSPPLSVEEAIDYMEGFKKNEKNK